MEKFLWWIGIGILLIGGIKGLMDFSNFDFSSYNSLKDRYEINDDLFLELQVYKSALNDTLLFTFISVALGSLLMSLAKILELITAIKEKVAPEDLIPRFKTESEYK